jgi:putative polyhydroxyalkanoate system protein
MGARMSNPLTVDLPHQLGAEEARRRIERNVGRLTDHIPGGAQVSSRWTGDRLDLDVAAMGQQVAARIDVQEQVVRLTVTLPPALAFFGGMIEPLIRKQGAAMLEDKSKG